MRLPGWGLREAVDDRFVGVEIRQQAVVLFSPTGRYVVVGDRDLTAVARPASGICAAGVEVGGGPDR